ncbi:hypothetical protein GCM10009760_33360 [Kitasatospora kazusensis]|uniref:Secreted protein n=1 Tax=Kitasatospora kazusensis TaxID=407974 RepID=A0ABP5LEF6_9ACTN
MGHPVIAVWALLLVALLALLPCADRVPAGAQTPPSAAGTMFGPTAGTTAVTGLPALSARSGSGTTHSAHARPPAHAQVAAAASEAADPALTWCSADGRHPQPGDGCSDQPFRGAESQLPNAPPQPTAIVPARLVLERAVPSALVVATQVGPDHAPDLHTLQVHRA